MAGGVHLKPAGLCHTGGAHHGSIHTNRKRATVEVKASRHYMDESLQAVSETLKTLPSRSELVLFEARLGVKLAQSNEDLAAKVSKSHRKIEARLEAKLAESHADLAAKLTRSHEDLAAKLTASHGNFENSTLEALKEFLKGQGSADAVKTEKNVEKGTSAKSWTSAGVKAAVVSFFGGVGKTAIEFLKKRAEH